MNKRQKKKNNKLPLTLVIRIEAMLKPDEYIKIRRLIQSQIDQGGAVVLPPYAKVEGIIKGSGKRQVIIKHKSEV